MSLVFTLNLDFAFLVVAVMNFNYIFSPFTNYKMVDNCKQEIEQKY
jgi:hypothetical protein